jgi:preprotein translocase SecE subunit
MTQKKAASALKKSGYLAESVEELKKVTFPSREETLKTSFWALLFVIFFAAILALYDVGFRYLLRFIVSI